MNKERLDTILVFTFIVVGAFIMFFQVFPDHVHAFVQGVFWIFYTSLMIAIYAWYIHDIKKEKRKGEATA